MMEADGQMLHDAAIVGCGPTGLVLGLLLAGKGHRVVILERHTAPYPLPRAIAYDHEVARILDAVGVSGAMSSKVGLPGTYQWRNAAHELLFELAWNGPGLSGFPNSYVFSQPELEAVLNEEALKHPLITILRGQEVSSFTQNEDGIALRTVSGLDIQARYLVGADGANSLIRAGIGGHLVDLGFSADWLVVDVRPCPGVKLPVDDDVMLQICDPARPTTVVSGGPGRRRWEFMALAGETLEELNCAERAWALLTPWKVTPENAVLERHAVYRFRGAVADRWRQGRVFIAGDAAHLTPPFAGQGLCAGVRDAASLAWRLDLALHGQSAETLLDSYGSERRVHAEIWVKTAIELGKVICVLDPQAAAIRDQALCAIRQNPSLAPPPPPPARLGPGMVVSGGGLLSAGGIVESNGCVGLLDRAVGRGFVLLSRGKNPSLTLNPELRAFWDGIGGLGAGFGPGGNIRDVGGAYTAWLNEIDVDTVLVRPDFYVFGAASGPDAADQLVLALRSFFMSALQAA